MGRRADEEITQARAALGAACGQILNLTFDAANGNSVAAAVRAMENLIDWQAFPFRDNDQITELAADLKQSLREAIWAEAGVKLQ